MHDLIDLAPPGIDELVAITDVLDALDAPAPEGYGLVVIDTAPTGHALRLLETPGLVHDWVRTLMSIVLKYQPVVGIGELGETLLALSQGLGRLRERLTDPARTRFIAVTRPGALPRAETERLVARLRSMRIAVPGVIVNALGRGTCGRCRRASAAERLEIAALRRGAARWRQRPLVLAPLHLPPPQGPARLRRWAAGWRVAGPAISSGSR
jgi:arsenite-transporting ATPase